MPACDARYDVILDDGSASWNSHNPSTAAIVDMLEQREPDDWGEPGKLTGAELVRYWAGPGKLLTYDSIDIGGRKRMRLWVRGTPYRARAKHRRYLRWAEPEWAPPIDPEYDDPA